MKFFEENLQGFEPANENLLNHQIIDWLHDEKFEKSFEQKKFNATSKSLK